MIPFNTDQRFWITLWSIVLPIVCIIALGLAYIIHNKDLEMAKAGYMQKVIVIGNPNDQYTRRVETVWVPRDTVPVIETK
jgi:hypothetical protein